MVKAKLSSNGMINFPAKLRKKLDLKPGDEVSFVESAEGILIVPIKNILDATNSDNYDIAVEMVKEIRQERNTEKW
ncbi:MAG: AbrB/MazE/SpoVT family DNA-binding domain-containing protein [Candidatus Heimdallarchaeota archaeon]|nr:AbrB/MazE/SpoVT family DNA-binding domain-containing protein [Candidatus Heimdallarchaeota archaeon]